MQRSLTAHFMHVCLYEIPALSMCVHVLVTLCVLYSSPTFQSLLLQVTIVLLSTPGLRKVVRTRDLCYSQRR